MNSLKRTIHHALVSPPLALFVSSGQSSLRYASVRLLEDLVTGLIWPRKDVGANGYRLRIFDGANARVPALKFCSCSGNAINYSAYVNLSVYKIGIDGEWLPASLGENDG